MIATPSMDKFYDLARCLGRPVGRGWLDVAVAEAILTLAVCRLDLDGLDPVALAGDLNAVLRQAVAS